MKKKSIFLVPSLVLLIAILLPSTTKAQYGIHYTYYRNKDGSVISSCERMPFKETFAKFISKGYEEISSSLEKLYSKSIADIQEKSGNQKIKDLVKHELKTYLTSNNFKYWYGTLFKTGKPLEILEKEYPTLNRNHIAALRHYTEEGFAINEAIANGFADPIYENENYKGLSHVLNDGLSKLPDWSGDGDPEMITWHGVPIDREWELSKNWSIGDHVKFNDYISSSPNYKEAKQYINWKREVLIDNWEEKYMWKIIDTKAPSIGTLSNNNYSSETIFRAPSQFEVVDIEDVTGKYKLITLRHLELLDPEPSFQLEYEATGSLSDVDYMGMKSVSADDLFYLLQN